MSSPPRAISLKCVSCGAKLEITADMDRFACGYCGTEQLVERKGGTVALRGVEEAINRVQAGTDRTAAELALNRLSGELQAAEAERVKVEAQVKAAENAGCAPGCIVGFVIMFIGGAIMQSQKSSLGGNDSGSQAIAVIFFILAVVVGIAIWRTSGTSGVNKFTPALEAARAKEQDIRVRIEKQRRIVDS